MAQQTLDDRVGNSQADLQALVGAAPPVSTDNTNDQPAISADQQAAAGPKRIYINGQAPAPEPEHIDFIGSPSNGSATTASTPSGDQLSGVGGPTEGGLQEATLVDSTDSILAQRRQQAFESLKAEGFDGYTPSLEGADAVKNWSQDDQYAMNKAIQDIGAGFNISLAKALSLPRETVDQGLAMLGLDFMQHGSPQQHTIDSLNRMGIPAYEVDNLANKIGRGALPALATWAAIQLGAPGMAANTGTGVASHLMREVGEWALKHPVVGMWLGQTSNAGGEIATHVINPQTELGKNATNLAGNIIGGVGPSIVKGAAKASTYLVPGLRPAARFAGKMVGAGIDAIADNLPVDLGNAIKKYNPLYKQPLPKNAEALVNPHLDANRIQSFAQDQIVGAQRYQDKAIENAINSIPTTGTPAQVQARTHDLLQDAEKISKRIVSTYWNKVPLKTQIKVGGIRTDTAAMKLELKDNDNTRPDELIDKVLAATRLIRMPNGTFKGQTPTIAKLRDLQSQIGTAITEERARDAPREGMVRNMARLSEIIDNGIATELPNNTSIEQARQMSKRHNDLFSRGPINDILSKRRSGDFRLPTSDSIDNLMQKTDGLAALKAVQEGVSTYPRIPTTRFQSRAALASPYAVTPEEKQQLDALVKSAEDAIRSSFREAAEQGPQKAVAFAQKNEEAIKALSNVAGELAFAAQKTVAALNEQKLLRLSALAKFAETSADKAVSNIFAQKDPAGVARQLMISFKGDPDALEGLRNQTLTHFIYAVGKTNPNIMQKMLMEPRYANLMEAVLSPDQFGRLGRMVNTAVRIGAEDEHSFKAILASPAKTVGRIIGAMVGRRLETGTMQGPSLVSQRVGKWMESAFGNINPSDLLSQAVLDPEWEALLYSRNPVTTKAMNEAKKHYRRIFAGINTAQSDMLRNLSKEDDNDE